MLFYVLRCLLQLLIILINSFLTGTYRFFQRIASVSKIETTYVDMTNLENLKKALRHNTRVKQVILFTDVRKGLNS